MTIQFADDRVTNFLIQPDSDGRRLVVMTPRSRTDPRFDYRNYFIPFTKPVIESVRASDSGRFVLALERNDAQRAHLSGRLRDDSVDVVLRRIDDSRFLLRRWGMHAVNRIDFPDSWIVAPYTGWPVDTAANSRARPASKPAK